MRWKFFRKEHGTLLSFPKSGRTWMRVMFDQLNTRLEYTHGEGGAGHQGATHLQEMQFFDKWLKRKRLIFLYRDPRDTVVSGYFHARYRLQNFSGELPQFLRDPRHGLEKVCHFNLGWMERGLGEPNFYSLSYEALSADTAGQMMRCMDFLGRPVDPLTMQAVVRECSFENMQRAEGALKYKDAYGQLLAPVDPSNPDSFKVRKGKVGGFRESFSEQDLAYCDEVLQRLDYFSRLKA
jgi:hypothetical protein